MEKEIITKLRKEYERGVQLILTGELNGMNKISGISEYAEARKYGQKD